MPATLAKRGYGTQLKLGNGASPPLFTAFAEVKSISGFGINKPLEEATHLESPDDTKEYIPGMKDGKTPTFTCNLTTANATILKNLIDSSTNSTFQLVYPGTLPDFRFDGTPTDWEIGAATAAGILEVTFQIKIAGAIT